MRPSQAASPIAGSWARLADTPDPVPLAPLLLPSGKVMAPDLTTYYTTARIYDPTSNTWSPTSSFGDQLAGDSAALLPSGKVLLVGGLQDCPSEPCYQTTAVLYDPVSDKWTTGKASMQNHRYFASAVTLHSGKVLVFGGVNADAPIGLNYLTSVETYDPTRDAWATAASLSTAREGGAGIVLPDGDVLVFGGIGPSANAASPQRQPSPKCGTGGCPVPVQSVERYDPIHDVWSSAESLPDDRIGYTVTLLPTGKVLVAGGLVGGPNSTTPAATNLLYDPSTNSWTQAAVMNHQRGDHTATLLATGDVLIAGGVPYGLEATAELYDPRTNLWTLAPQMPRGHIQATAVALLDGRVMVNGGDQGPGCCAAYPTLPTFGSPAPRGGGPTAEVDAFSTVPGLPGSVKASASNGSAKVTWTAATPDGSSISGYTVTASPGGKQVKAGGTATSATLSGLTNGAHYTFTVTATNAYGAGPASAPSNGVTPSVPPTPTPTPGGNGGGNGNGNGNGTGGGPTGQTGATPTATSAPAATATPVPQTVVSNPPPGPPSNANRSTGGSPPFALLGVLVLLILLLGGGAVVVFARRSGNGGSGSGSGM